jgi:gluconolactonase
VKSGFVTVCALAASLFAHAAAISQDNPIRDLTQVPTPTGVLQPAATVEVAALVCFFEGPAVDQAGNVFFSDVTGNRILKLAPDGAVSEYRTDSGRANGNAFDRQGRLVTCEGYGLGPGGRRRVVRTDLHTGEMTVLADRYEGKRYNSPNDLCVDLHDRIWFTDPRYGDRAGTELDVDGVYRIDPDGRVVRVLSHDDVQRCKGPMGSPSRPTLRRYMLSMRTTSREAIAKSGALKFQTRGH